ncbi:restriction endonuclease subunit S [Filifactor alocis]
MKLTRYKLGELIEQSDERNKDDVFTSDDVVGLSTQKMMIETKADLEGVKMSSYKVFPQNYFAYVADTSRRGDKISLAFNNKKRTFIVSSISTVFRVNMPEVLSSEYLFMYFNRPEFDRYARFNSWGSARETFDWSDMCDIDIDFPPLPIQEKYVAIYNGLLKNQQSYERGLEDLRLVCDAYIENLRKTIVPEEIGPYIEEINIRNINNMQNIQGVESESAFCETRANTIGLNISNYKVVKKDQFAYNPSRINLGSIALRTKDVCVVSPMYIVFEVKSKDKLISEFLMIWFGRREFQRSTLFYATGSVRDTFDFNLMREIKVPIPEIKIQQSIANIYKVYKKRKEINEQLKKQIKDICPILIKGSIEEAKK